MAVHSFSPGADRLGLKLNLAPKQLLGKSQSHFR